MSTELETMSINVFTNNKEAIMKTDNSTHEYILKLNEEYNNENIKLRLKVQELRNKIDDIEGENDRFETSNRYMKGLLKNYIELKDLYKKINNRRQDLSNLDMKQIRLYKDYNTVCENIYERCMNIYYISMLVYLYMGLIDYKYILLSLVTFVSSLYYLQVYYDINKYKYDDYKIVEELKLNIKKDNKNISEIENGNDFLEEYIDNI
tara:strand:- start:702 stop:1322 length:621 start_codon:yes stop_codon:yes gene_type:complete